MSSGILDEMARSVRADRPQVRVQWFGDDRPARGAAREADHWHFQVELPSRRWYVEAAERPAGQ